MNAETSSRFPRRLSVLLFAIALLGAPVATVASGGVFVSVAIAPPPIPVYVQPVAPAPGYIWTPGYWAYGPDGYYWVPGAWVLAPYVGALWTPGYWGWSNGLYVWNAGYWGARVGFYGGINYGFGYTGNGYYGGYWRGNAFYYNQAANNVNRAAIHTTYNRTINYTGTSRVSYNGGTGGIRAQPDAAQRAYMSQPHTVATTAQLQHEQAASNQRALQASVNHGRPASTTIAGAGAFGHPRTTPAPTAPTRNAAANSGAHTQGAVPSPVVSHATRAGAPQQAPQKMSAQQTARALPQGAPPAHAASAPHASPQRYATSAPQSHPQIAPQAPPQRFAQAAPQGHPQAGPQGHPKGGTDAGGEGHHGK